MISSRPHIVFAGGGTGGHVFPIKSLIQTLLTYTPHFSGTITRAGSAGSLEANIASEFAGSVKFVPFFSGKFRRERTLLAMMKNIRDIVLLFVGCLQAMNFLLSKRVDVVFCKGGYAALPVVFAAAALKIPLVVHESDTRPGLVNRIAARFAQYVFIAFPDVLPRAQVIGQLLSDDLAKPTVLEQISRPEYTHRTIVMVSGGSLGARKLYEAVAHLVHSSAFSDFFFVIIGGKMNQEASQLFANTTNTHWIDFVSASQFADIYMHADVAITRAGTTSLAEQKFFGLASIIVPLPVTHDQEHNARRYVQHHGDTMVIQDAHFHSHLEKALLSFKNFKKSDINLSHLRDALSTPKNKVLKTLLNIVEHKSSPVK